MLPEFGLVFRQKI